MHRCVCGVVSCYKFGLYAYLGVIFVAVECFVTLLGPSRVSILVALLVGLVCPKLVPFAILYGGVFFPGVALAGGDNETCVYHLALVNYKTQCCQMIVKVPEHSVIAAALTQGLPVFLYRAGIGNVRDRQYA